MIHSRTTKKFLLPLLLLSVILAGCGKQWLSQEQLFQKKQECASYKEKIEKDIKEKYRSASPSLSLSASLDEIFYSPIRNSCLYTVIISSSWTPKFRSWQVETKKVIMDYFANQQLWEWIETCSIIKEGKYVDCFSPEEIKSVNSLVEGPLTYFKWE